jgi:hypothetical protein
MNGMITITYPMDGTTLPMDTIYSRIIQDCQ